jgi:hypothetical protein
LSGTLFPTPLKLAVILIEEFEDTKGVIIIRESKNIQHNGHNVGNAKRVIIIRESKKNRQHNGQNLENAKRVIRIRESKKNRQHNGQFSV